MSFNGDAGATLAASDGSVLTEGDRQVPEHGFSRAFIVADSIFRCRA